MSFPNSHPGEDLNRFASASEFGLYVQNPLSFDMVFTTMSNWREVIVSLLALVQQGQGLFFATVDPGSRGMPRYGLVALGIKNLVPDH